MTDLPTQLTFHDLDPSDAIAEYTRKRAGKLTRFYDRITSCRVAIESPHRHHLHGRQFRVRIDIGVPGTELVIGRGLGERHPHDDVYAAIDDAFDDAQRVLADHARRLRDSRRPRA
jgi:ribosomal subunit interface protein